MNLRLLPLAALLLAGSARGETDVVAIMRDAESAFVRADLVEAMDLYRRAAEAGHAPAQLRLGYLLDVAEDNAAAEIWYRRAAEQGLPAAQFALGEFLAKGDAGDRDGVAALEWIELAAAQGEPGAIRFLANTYEHGGLGVQRSFERAREWLEAGVAIGDAWSRERLGRAYALGELGLRVDHGRAEALRGAPR